MGEILDPIQNASETDSEVTENIQTQSEETPVIKQAESEETQETSTKLEVPASSEEASVESETFAASSEEEVSTESETSATITEKATDESETSESIELNAPVEAEVSATTEETPDVAETSESEDDNAEAVEKESEDNAEVAAEGAEDNAENAAEEKHIYADRAEIIARLEEIAKDTSETAHNEVAHLKTLYYKMRQQETDAALQAILDAPDADPTAYVSTPDNLEGRLKELLNIHKDARATAVEARTRVMADNLAKKTDILDQMEKLATDANDVNVHYPVFMDLQKRFKEVGPVDASVANDLWKRYAQITEIFYDILRINKDLRDYDFRKNLEKKEALCEEAERLGTQNDVVGAFRRLQELHEEWKGMGPVAPAQREAIWARFRAASSVINKRHQAHFDQLKAREAENEAGKIALCEKIEAVEFDNLSTAKAWDEKTAIILSLQAEWKKLGFASRKVNNQLFERFRRTCDKFFAAKSAFFQTLRTEQAANLEKKIALCEQVEALKDSQEWRKTAEAIIALQKEWKAIGAVPRKHVNSIWKRFSAACDAFFEAKAQALAPEREEERANLEKKRSVIARLKELKESDDATQTDIRTLLSEWSSAGRVPFRDKDKLQKEFHALLEYFCDKLGMKMPRRRSDGAGSNAAATSDNSPSGLLRERERLMRSYEKLKADLKIYENNVGFLTAASKSGSALLQEIEKKKDAIKSEIQAIVQKVENIDKDIEAQE